MSLLPWIKWAATGIVVALIAGSGYATYLWAYGNGRSAETEKANVKAQVLVAALARAETANQANTASIETLQRQNVAFQKACTVDPLSTTTAVQAVTDADRAAAADTQSALNQRGKSYASDHDAAAWSLEPVPVSLGARFVREPAATATSTDRADASP